MSVIIFLKSNLLSILMFQRNIYYKIPFSKVENYSVFINAWKGFKFIMALYPSLEDMKVDQILQVNHFYMTNNFSNQPS